jgi:hypothetical protein
MKQRIVWRAVGLCIAVSMVGAAYGQGVYWEAQRSGGSAGGKTVTEKMYYMPKKFKSESGDEGQAVIFRLDKEVMYMVNTKEKTYSEVTFAEMEGAMKKMGSKMDAAMAKMQKEMEGMPEEQRKMVEKMMKGKMPGKNTEGTEIEVTKTGEKKTINGYSCTKYVLGEKGKELLSLWVTKDVKDFEGMRKDFEQFRQRMMAMNPMMAKGVAAKINEVEGFPIETDMGGGMRQVVTKIERKPTPPGEFEIPAGYKKVKSPMLGTQEEGESREKEENP